MFTWSSGYINFSYYCSDGRCRTSIGIAISNSDFKKGKIASADQLTMQRIRTNALEYIKECEVMKRKILRANLKEKVNIALGRLKSSNTFIADWEAMMEDMRSGKLLTPKHKKRYKPGTIRGYGINLGRLTKFSQDERQALKYDQIDEEWLKRLNTWAINNKFKKGTIVLFTSQLKAFLRLMKGKGRHYSEAAESKELVHRHEDVNNNVATYEHEIWALYNLPLTRGKKRARDVYVFGCGVGLRVEDLNRINEYKLVDNAFEFLTSKTDKKIKIPIHWLSKRIYEEYQGKLPLYTTSFGLGKHLPDICRMAGITKPKLVVETVGGVTSGTYYDKCDLVTPHTMRRSFASNAVINGLADRLVMEVTGHDSLESFKRYIIIEEDIKMQTLQNNQFFTGHAFLQAIDKLKHPVPVVKDGLPSSP